MKILLVIISGAGPPLEIFNFTPKSPSIPPGLWLAERIIPPIAFSFLIKCDVAGVDNKPHFGTIIF